VETEERRRWCELGRFLGRGGVGLGCRDVSFVGFVKLVEIDTEKGADVREELLRERDLAWKEVDFVWGCEGSEKPILKESNCGKKVREVKGGKRDERYPLSGCEILLVCLTVVYMVHDRQIFLFCFWFVEPKQM
jgi:hypothetical protein